MNWKRFRISVISPIALAIFALVGTLATAGESKISFRQITRTHPIAVQRGTKARVEVSSVFTLHGAHSAFFVPSGPKMTYASKKSKPVDWADPQESDIGDPYPFDVEVPPDQLPGIHEYRIATNQSVSSVAHLLVTDHPVVLETTNKNESQSTAQRVPIPSAICGVIDDFEDVDYYRISGKQGDDVVAQIYAQRVTRSIHCMAIEYPKLHLMDAMLTLFDSRGQIVAQNDNFYGGDSFFHCRLPANGEYVLEVRDSRYTGDPRYVYCVEITSQSHTFGSFPMSIRHGDEATVKLITSRPSSVNSRDVGLLDFGQNDDLLTRRGWFVTRGSGSTQNPTELLVSDHPQVVANDRHNTWVSANRISIPCGVSSRFDQPDREHYYKFNAEKDGYYRFEVNSQRRGYAVDSVISILSANGKVVASSDDGWFTKDATLFFKAPTTAEFFVNVRDLNRRAGPRFKYHLTAEHSGPDFEVHGEYYYGMMSPGGHAIWFVKLKRLNGFNGPVEIRSDGLPKGVTFTPVTIPAGMNHCGLIFSAAADAKINASLVNVTGHGSVQWPDGRKMDLVRKAHVTCELRRAGASRFYRSPIRTQLLAVTKPLDVTRVTATPTTVKLAPGKTAEIKVRIERSPNYKDQVLLDTAFSFFSTKFGQQLPPGVSIDSSSQAKLTGKTLEGKIVLKAAATALQVKDYPMAVLARVPITYSIMTNYASNPIQLTIEGGKKE